MMVTLQNDEKEIRVVVRCKGDVAIVLSCPVPYLLVLAVREVRLLLVEPVKLPRLLRHHLIELLDEAVHPTITSHHRHGSGDRSSIKKSSISQSINQSINQSPVSQTVVDEPASCGHTHLPTDRLVQLSICPRTFEPQYRDHNLLLTCYL